MNEVRVVNNIHILLPVVWSFAWSGIRNPGAFRFQTVRSAWNLIKLQAATGVQNIETGQIKGIDRVTVDAPVTSHDRAVLCAITKLVGERTFFEIGTFLGETTLAVARNNPDARIYTLDLPSSESRATTSLEMTDDYLFERWDRGSAFQGTPEASRITMLTGDSATFDFSPYAGTMDAVFIDASHSYSYVKSDTEAALRLLSPTGTILWHDYPAYPGIYAWLNELGARQGQKIYHIIGTGIAFSSRSDLVR